MFVFGKDAEDQSQDDEVHSEGNGCVMRAFFCWPMDCRTLLVMVDRAENTTETAPIISSFPERLELDGNRTPVIGNASTPRPTAAGWR